MSALARAVPVGTGLDGDAARFARWASIWLLLANAPFMAMWLVGAPPRVAAILAAGTVGLVVRRMPVWVQRLAFVAVMTYAALSFVAGLFNLGLGSLFYSLQYFAEIDPANAAEYLIAAGAILAVTVAACRLMRGDSAFVGTGYLALAVGGIGAVAAADHAVGQDMRGHYFRAAHAGAPFESAVQKSGFAAATGDRHLMLVMVESLGLPRGNTAMQGKLFAAYDSASVRARYDVSRGSTLYYNSTTAGELRELCGRWGDYPALLDGREDGGDCLPARLARRGFASQAVHSFKAPFFHRRDWYPMVGFQDAVFDRKLRAEGAEWCGGVFPGACDRDVPRLLARRLKAAERPTFLYWLTLNAHLPVPTGANLRVDDCAATSPALARDYPMICRQYAIFDAIDRALVAEITADDFPATDILIVGDHMPPFFDRHHRSQFDPARVPWLYLRHRGD